MTPTFNLQSSELGKKVKNAIKLIKAAEESNRNKTPEQATITLRGGGQNITLDSSKTGPELCYSSGKDSDVILYLAKTAGINFTPIYKHTSIDPPLSIEHALSNNVLIAKPKLNFWKLIQKNGLPTPRTRFCCRHLKEYKILNTAILGIRKAESSKRKKNYTEYSQCRIFNNIKSQRTEQFYPILDFSNQDIKELIKTENIQLHPLYYDNDELHPERRLGCITCPLKSRQLLIHDFSSHPSFINAYLKNLNIYYSSHSNKTTSLFSSPYNHLFFHILCPTLTSYHDRINNTLLPLNPIEELQKIIPHTPITQLPTPTPYRIS